MEYLQYKDLKNIIEIIEQEVLNLVINGIPSILYNNRQKRKHMGQVLNLVINGIPSIRHYSTH